MQRVYNFSAGPAVLPEEVLVQVRDELLDWHGTGMSIMEIGHRTADFVAIAETTAADLKELLAIPSNYRILFLSGGGRAQFAMVPLNLLGRQKTADYIDTGIWSKMAAEEATRYGSVNIVASNADQNYFTIPSPSQWRLSAEASYFHYVDNETINGVEFPYVPEINNAKALVADMSSNILSRPVDVSRFGLIYAGAQKNMGPAGITVVIIREDLIGNALPITPTIFNYKTHVDTRSLFNTPATFSWYVLGLVLQWLKRQGGISAMSAMHQRRSKKLYEFIDASEFYYNSVDKLYRSRVNIVFRLKNENLNNKFLQEAKQVGLVALKGHSMVGGMRASLYNALPDKAVDTLIEFMKMFARKNS